jgi:hypothetical protein
MLDDCFIYNITDRHTYSPDSGTETSYRKSLGIRRVYMSEMCSQFTESCNARSVSKSTLFDAGCGQQRLMIEVEQDTTGLPQRSYSV